MVERQHRVRREDQRQNAQADLQGGKRRRAARHGENDHSDGYPDIVRVALLETKLAGLNPKGLEDPGADNGGKRDDEDRQSRHGGRCRKIAIEHGGRHNMYAATKKPTTTIVAIDARKTAKWRSSAMRSGSPK